MYYFGVVDSDKSVLSGTLIEKLEERFMVIEKNKEDISEALTDDDIPWVLLIPEGFSDALMNNTVPELEGYSLTVSDFSALGSVYAESITRSLMLMGTEDEEILSEWLETSRVSSEFTEKGDNWGAITFWLGFFGFISMLTAYFVVKTLTEDKRRGMPDRLGVLPMHQRNYLIQSVLAAFVATEITVALLMLVIFIFLGAIPNFIMLFLLLSLYNLFTVSMVFAVISFLKDLGAASVVVSLSATIFAMLGGVFWPLELVPDFMQKLAWFSPGYWLVRGISDIKTVTFGGYGIAVLFLSGFTAVAILLGGWKKIQIMDD
jgi:ABC-2 type transport system permease protein